MLSQIPTLFTTPAVYLYLDRLGAWSTNKRKPHATEASSPRAKRYHREYKVAEDRSLAQKIVELAAGERSWGIRRCARAIDKSATVWRKAASAADPACAINRSSCNMALSNEGCIVHPRRASQNIVALVPRGGIEPPTLRFSVACSTN
jgi:hypothetical protein